MKFQKIQDLINSEGSILSLAESVDREDFINERLYLKASCLNGNANIYCKVNPFALEIFFQGRIAVKELFLLRVDEEFIIEYNETQTSIVCDEEFISHVVETINCSNYHYYSFTETMRDTNPFDGILHRVERDYINGFVSVMAGIITGRRWLTENGIGV